MSLEHYIQSLAMCHFRCNDQNAEIVIISDSAVVPSRCLLEKLRRKKLSTMKSSISRRRRLHRHHSEPIQIKSATKSSSSSLCSPATNPPAAKPAPPRWVCRWYPLQAQDNRLVVKKKQKAKRRSRGSGGWSVMRHSSDSNLLLQAPRRRISGCRRDRAAGSGRTA